VRRPGAAPPPPLAADAEHGATSLFLFAANKRCRQNPVQPIPLPPKLRGA